jgi:GlpG protein
MRLIGTLENERQGIVFSQFLTQKKIAHQVEILTNHDWGSPDYGTSQCRVWISEEDQFKEALEWYNLFLEHPHDPQFKAATLFTPQPAKDLAEKPPEIETSTKTDQAWDYQSMGPLTRLMLILCCGLFFLSQLLTPVINTSAKLPATPLFSSPIEKAIIYDYPFAYQLVDRLIKLYGYEALQTTDNLPPEGERLVQQINHTPYWQGIYGTIVKKGFGAIKEQIQTVPMFEKIRQGQIWRLISPAFFHASFFHLFFNMLWLIVLSKQIEQRLGIWRTLSFVLIVGIISNTAQYLISGPNFVGFSGVLCGMLTFIWMRQYYAPWEGYQLDKATIVFMLLYICFMALLQLVSFVLETNSELSISTGIANMAHLMGALMGIILARLNFFNWRAA